MNWSRSTCSTHLVTPQSYPASAHSPTKTRSENVTRHRYRTDRAADHHHHPAPATDLGYLLHKHPDRLQSFATAAGAGARLLSRRRPRRGARPRCCSRSTRSALVRGRKGTAATAAARPVRQRPALRRLEHARRGAQGGLPHRADRPLRRAPRAGREPHPAGDARPRAALPGRRSTSRTDVFAPLGWTVEARQPARSTPPEWGDSPYLDLRLTGELRLADALNHLYVLLPVLDDAKHYWVSHRRGGQADPGRRRLAGRPPGEGADHPPLPGAPRELTQSALARLAEADDTDPAELDNAVTAEDDRRTGTSRWPSSAARPSWPCCASAGARRVGDLGCGAGVLTRDLLAEPRLRPGRRHRRVRPGAAAGRPPACSWTRCPDASASG